MLQRLRNFVNRHRKKFIFGGFVIGGAVLTWRVLLPKLQERLLRKLLEEAAAGLPLQELTQGSKKRSKDEFGHKQEVSDAYARRALASLRAGRFPSLFKVEECRARLQEPNLSRESKLERFNELQVECLARVVAAMYTLTVQMLLYRVAFNIIGRSMGTDRSSSSAQDASMSAESFGDAGEGKTAPKDEAILDTMQVTFLDACARAFEEQPLADIASSARSGVMAHCQAEEILPTRRLASKDLERLLLKACQAIHEKIFAVKDGGSGNVTVAAAFLPESLDGETTARSKDAKALLDEARDYLESPQFLEVVKRVVTLSAENLVEKLCEATSTELGADLPAVAKLFGQLVELSNSVLEADHTNEYADGFTQEPLVNQFCESIFFQGDDQNAGCPQQ
jgi:hypothetical protein